MDVITNFTHKQFMKNKSLKQYYSPMALQAIYELLQAEGLNSCAAKVLQDRDLANVVVLGKECIYIDLY
jgi:hypothetical protein